MLKVRITQTQCVDWSKIQQWLMFTMIYLKRAKLRLLQAETDAPVLHFKQAWHQFGADMETDPLWQSQHRPFWSICGTLSWNQPVWNSSLRSGSNPWGGTKEKSDMFQICFAALLRGNRAHVGTFKGTFRSCSVKKYPISDNVWVERGKKPTKEDTDFSAVVLNLVRGTEPHQLFSSWTLLAWSD